MRGRDEETKTARSLQVDQILLMPCNRWRLCITDTDAVFGFALGSLFVEKSFNGRSKPVAQECTSYISKVLRTKYIHSKMWPPPLRR